MQTQQLAELMQAAATADSVTAVQALCSAVCDALEVDYFVYAARFSNSFVKPGVLIVSGYPSAWREHYQASNYFATDPVVQHCLRYVTPLRWHDLRARGERQALAFMAEAADFGLASGVTVPVHGGRGDAALFSVADGRGGSAMEAQLERRLPELHLLSSYIHEAVLRLPQAAALGSARRRLSDRERDCLLWSAEGKTSWEIAQILGVSERTVVFHLQNAARKLEVSSRPQAVARAVAQGLILPQFG